MFIFGAGASRQGGAPTMATFVDDAERVLKKGQERDQLELVLKFKDDCKTLHSYSTMDLENLEALYGIAEMARVTRKFGSYDASRISDVTEAFQFVMSTTIERTLAFPSKRGVVYPPDGYNELIKSISEHSRDIAFITLNYDLGLDYALFTYGLPFDYCLHGSSGSTKLLKLHGSLNWYSCPECGEIEAWELRAFFGGHSWRPLEDGRHTLNLSAHLGSAPEHCTGAGSPKRPLIVPPTWNKATHQQALGEVWAHAAIELSNARDIIIVGFSLPDTDMFFRYLYSVGVANARLRSIKVYDPDTEVAGRFRAMLGVGALPKFQHKTWTFRDALPEITGSVRSIA